MRATQRQPPSPSGSTPASFFAHQPNRGMANEMWADLLELIDTRMQLLAASYDLQRYFYTGSEILGLIDEKHRELPEDVGLDASTAESFHRVHTAFERELHLLGEQVPLAPSCPSTLPLTSIPGTM